MPQIGNDKQITIAMDMNGRVLAKIMYLKDVATVEERNTMMATLAEQIAQMNVNYLDDPDLVIEEYFFNVAAIMAINHKDDSKNKSIEAYFTSIIRKIVEIYAIRTKKADSLSCITKMLGKKSNLLYKQPYKMSVLSFRSQSEREPNSFYHQCVATALVELTKYHKIVWEIQLKELIELINFINVVQPNPLHTKEAYELIQALSSELLAYFKSGRPQLVKFCQSISSIKSLEEQFLKKVDRQPVIKFISQLGPTLAQTLLRNTDYDTKKTGLSLMEDYIDRYTFDKYGNKYKQNDWKVWVSKHEIYQLVFSDIKFCDSVIERYNNFFKGLKRYKNNEEKTQMLINLLKRNIDGEKISAYICKQLDCYFLDPKSKEILFEYFTTIPDFSRAPVQFLEFLQELPSRSQSDSMIQKVYSLMMRIMRQDYERMNDSHQHRCLVVFKNLFNKYYHTYKNKNSQTKQKMLKQTMLQLLTDINSIKILLFNLTVADGQMWKALSNTNFQNCLTEILEKTQFFDKVFKYLETQEITKMREKEFGRIIKFVTSKLTTKQDATFKYIHIISKFPDIFEELMESSTFAQSQELMKKVIKLFKENPQTPFHILTITFERINHREYSDFDKIPSLLQDKKEQKPLKNSPKSLKFYDAITQLILETGNENLRSELCTFVLSLYVNFKHAKYSYPQSGQQAFITFLTNLLDNLVNDYQEFIENPSLLNVILVDLLLIEKALEFTDILGCGGFKPHKSLVSTSTILLSVINNATFGDDVAKVVHRDFPSNMTLFDALTIIGMAFKCGPENIVLKQSGRFISPIYNSRSLEDLNFTSQQIIAEQSSANSLQTPQVLEPKAQYDYKAVPKLKPYIIKIITDVFNRFAYDGKMSLFECTNYIRQASGSQCISSDRRVKDIFDFDYDKDNIITLPDFIEYYKKNLTSGTFYKEQILKGLFNLRYRKNLTLYNEPLDISNQYYLMMRFKIAKSYQQIYEILFQFTRYEDAKLSKKAKQLLLYLPSYPEMKSQITKTINFDANTEFEVYYKLISIENELSRAEGEGGQNIAEAKQTKIEAFVHHKNNEIIFQLLCKYHEKINKSQVQIKSLLICLRILRSLINIEQLSTLNVYAIKLEKVFIPHLPPTTYFAQHTALAYQSRNIINYETLLVLQLTQPQVVLQPIIQCCFNPEEQIRKISCNFIYLWSLKTKFSFNLFQMPIAESYNEEWFDLLCGIIQENDNINLDFLKDKALKILAQRQETFHNQYDHLMYGYLKILSTIAKRHKIINPHIEQLFVHLLDHSFSQKNRALIFQLIKNQNREIGYAYFDKMLSSILPSQECLVREKYVGIKNLGAICYINSILQQFFMIDKFKHMVLSRSVPKDLQSVQVNGKIIVDDLMFQLQKLYHHLEFSQKKYIIPKEFCYAFKNFQGQPINTSIQQDAHEFLNRLIESAQQAFKKENQLGQFQKLLTIKKLSEIQCQVCKNRIDKYENDYCLMIQVKNHDNLIDSLRKFTEKQQISDYFCQKCNRKMNKIYKRTYLNQLPEIVILNLQRIIYDQQKGEKVKVHTQLSFPQSINFEDFIKNDNPNMQTEYNLKGVVIHTGTSQGGHYYSLIKTKKYGWLKFNDQNVTPFDEKDIERETFGGFQAKDGWSEVAYSTNAYILFYEKSNVDPHAFIQVENEFTEELHKQNVTLVNELQIHQESFFNAIISNYQMIRPKDLDQIIKTNPFMHSKPSKQLQRQYLELIKIVQKAFNFLNIYTEIRQEIRVKIGRILRELYFIMPEQTLTFFKQSNINTFIENIISNSTNNQREILKQTFVVLFLIHIRYFGIDLSIKNEANKYIFDILDIVFQYVQSKLFYSNVTKVSSYLHLLQLLMKSQPNVGLYLMQKQYFFKLLDLIMGKESPFMKHHPIAQDLPTNLLPFIFSSLDYLLPHKLNLKKKKPFQHSSVATSSLEAAILINPTFYRRIMRLKYDLPSLSNIIIHYSFYDIDYSAIVADFLIHGLNNRDPIVDLPLFFKHIRDFLMIKDNLQVIRFGWILGIPQNRSIGISNEEYCLQYSDRSDYVKYISGINYKKAIGESSRRPLLEIISQKKMLQGVTNIYGLKIVLELIIESELAFDYLINLPPPTYHLKCFFDWIPDYVSRLAKDSDVIIQKKMETMIEMDSMLDILMDKIKTAKNVLPSRRYIIGKTRQREIICKIEEMGSEYTLLILTTYILDNKPTGQDNESMPKKYFSSQNPQGIGNAFISNRSKALSESDKKELKSMQTLYVLYGRTNDRLMLIFKGNAFKHEIIVGQGQFSIVFPVDIKGDIEEIVDIIPFSDYKVDIVQQELESVFVIEKKMDENIMEEEKGDFNPAVPAAVDGFVQPKIKCSICTFDNELTRDHCQMCDNPLFN